MRPRTTKQAGPKPRTIRKAAPKPKCIRGHSLDWGQPPLSCRHCADQDRKAREGMPADEFRALRRAELGLGPPPDVMEMRTGDGQLLRFRPGPRRR